MQRPLYDVVAPSVSELASSLPEHLYWNNVSDDAAQTLTGPEHREQMHWTVARKAIANIRCHRHTLEKIVPFSRCSLCSCSLAWPDTEFEGAISVGRYSGALTTPPPSNSGDP
jgi:hypothetical protein